MSYMPVIFKQWFFQKTLWSSYLIYMNCEDVEFVLEMEHNVSLKTTSSTYHGHTNRANTYNDYEFYCSI